jgi:hypothetical protein
LDARDDHRQVEPPKDERHCHLLCLDQLVHGVDNPVATREHNGNANKQRNQKDRHCRLLWFIWCHDNVAIALRFHNISMCMAEPRVDKRFVYASYLLQCDEFQDDLVRTTVGSRRKVGKHNRGGGRGAASVAGALDSPLPGVWLFLSSAAPAPPKGSRLRRHPLLLQQRAAAASTRLGTPQRSSPFLAAACRRPIPNWRSLWAAAANTSRRRSRRQR